MSKQNTKNTRLKEMHKLLEELVEDNTAVAGSINRIRESQENLRGDLTREISSLRGDFAGALTFRVLKDVCNELIPPLAAMEHMLAHADFNDPATIRNHVDSLAISLRSVLGRTGLEKMAVMPGVDQFDPGRHRCVRALSTEESPFPNALPRTIVRIVEDGYLLAGRILSIAKVEVQADSSKIADSQQPQQQNQ